MAKFTSKIALPIVLASVFAVSIFIALEYEILLANFYVVVAIFFIFVIFFAIATGQNLTMPIKSLLEKTNDINNGDLKARANINTKDEIAELAKTLNQIADRLEKIQENSK